MLELQSLGGETSEEMSAYVLAVLEKEGICSKVVGISADNTNTNFGGSKRKGKQNVYVLLKKKLGPNLIGIGCSAHVVHNSIKAAADCLPIDVEIIIGKIFQYFSIYTVRVEKLKEFCNFCEVEYQRVKGYTKTRWLALLPGIERLLKMFEPLKSFFLSVEKPPVTILNFFENPCAEFWLYFLQSQAAIFQDTVKLVEGDSVTISAVSKCLRKLRIKLEARLKDTFIPFVAQSKLIELEKNGEADASRVKRQVSEFYQTALDYLQEWGSHFEDFEDHDWINLKQSIPAWNNLESSVLAIATKIENVLNRKLNDTQFYDQINVAREFATEVKIDEWEQSEVDAGQRWVVH